MTETLIDTKFGLLSLNVVSSTHCRISLPSGERATVNRIPYRTLTARFARSADGEWVASSTPNLWRDDVSYAEGSPAAKRQVATVLAELLNGMDLTNMGLEADLRVANLDVRHLADRIADRQKELRELTEKYDKALATLQELDTQARELRRS